MKVILTFDYELFLGEYSGTVLKSIIEPSNRILEILSEYDAKGIFFVDATYLYFLKERNHPDFLIVSKQLEEIVKRGHNVELHLHPQWIDACEAGEGGWKFSSYDHYRLHSLSEQEIVKTFVDCKNLLESVVRNADPEYKVTAFRAGGWSITPFEKLSKAFSLSQIEIDFSVLPESFMNDSDANSYDFRGAPDKYFWRFDDDPLVENEKGRYIEVPCTRYTRFGFTSILNKLLGYDNKFMGDGIGVSYSGHKAKILQSFLKKINYYFTIDYTAPLLFSQKVLSYEAKHDIISVYSHPKCFSKNSAANLVFLLKKYKTLTIPDIKSINSQL